jgi:LPPG:FO 2-phospho-L-lactate transferase
MLSEVGAVFDPGSVVAIVNTADDVVMHGLHISPDIDTVIYTLGGGFNPETGWGLRDETWQAMTTLERYGEAAWFRLGDRDIGTHLHRTGRLSAGATLSEVTAEVAAGWGVGIRILPMSDDRVETRVVVDEGEIGFQEYFVARRHAVAVHSLRFAGAEAAAPAPGVVDSLTTAERVVICPSNPLVSIGPIRAIAAIEAALRSRRDDVVAVSPIVAGAALKGPADRMMLELGHDPSVVGVARLYAPVAGTLVIDDADADHARAVEAEGVRCVVTSTVMRGPGDAARLVAGVTGVPVR